jgi:hypothetical protein
MSTTYLVEGVRTIRVEGDDISTRQDGSLWILVATAPKPAALTPVLILAKGEWHSVLIEGSNILFMAEPPVTVTEPPPEKKPTPRFA